MLGWKTIRLQKVDKFNSFVFSLILFFLLLVGGFSLNTYAKSKLPVNSQKSKNTIPTAKSVQNSATKPAGSTNSLKDIVNEVKAEDTETTKTEDEDKENKKEKIDPSRIYKIIAIYIIGDKPRALIKNLSTPEELPTEFQVGDYLDEMQIFSIAKISFNPTARVEIVDQNGLNYVMKPKSSDDKSVQGSSKTYTTSRSMPTYFSGGSAKSKSNKSDKPTATPPTEHPSAAQATHQATQADTTTKPADTTAKPADTTTKPSGDTQAGAATAGTPVPSQASQSLQAVSAGASLQATPMGQSKIDTTMTSPTSGASDSTRPSNPFGE